MDRREEGCASEVVLRYAVSILKGLLCADLCGYCNPWEPLRRKAVVSAFSPIRLIIEMIQESHGGKTIGAVVQENKTPSRSGDSIHR